MNLSFERWNELKTSNTSVRIALSEFNPNPRAGGLISVFFADVPGQRWFEVTEVTDDYFVLVPTAKRPPKE